MSTRGHETEIKLSFPSSAAAKLALRRAGFRVSRRRLFEANTVFDTAPLTLRASQRLLRVRQAGGVCTVTYKGPPQPSPYKSREELEVTVSRAAAIADIFRRLDFHPVFRYEKYRTEFRRPASSGIATVDETPIGIYVELEGRPQWIDRTARTLGFTAADYITASYGRLYLDWCAAHRQKPADMLLPPKR